MQDEWPTHRAELTRKASEQLQHWSVRFDAGEISLDTFIMVLGALWHVTSGLIEEDVARLISDVQADAMRNAIIQAHIKA